MRMRLLVVVLLERKEEMRGKRKPKEKGKKRKITFFQMSNKAHVKQNRWEPLDIIIVGRCQFELLLLSKLLFLSKIKHFCSSPLLSFCN